MRVFLAFDLEVALIDFAIALSDGLAARVRQARFQKRETMHVTVRFFGDGVELGRVSGLAARLVEGRARPRVRMTKLDAFPDARRAKVLVLSLEHEATLVEIAKEAERLAVERGFEEEKRAYRPHLTLARFREPADVRKLVAETEVAREGNVLALTLYESKLGPGGPTYAPLERATFER